MGSLPTESTMGVSSNAQDAGLLNRESGLNSQCALHHPVAQRIERRSPKTRMRVEFPPG